MFYTDKDTLQTAIDILQRECCVYDHYEPDSERLPPSFCDCKYGYSGDKKYSEQSACPELRCVSHLLKVMTDEEYAILINRKNKPETSTISTYWTVQRPIVDKFLKENPTFADVLWADGKLMIWLKKYQEQFRIGDFDEGSKTRLMLEKLEQELKNAGA